MADNDPGMPSPRVGHPEARLTRLTAYK